MVLAARPCYRMVLAYDGTGYHGWQAQPQVATVQGELDRALGRLTQERPRILAAGRTDAGAHAHGQVISFSLSTEWLPETLRGACNALLPEDISVLEVGRADPAFHPRWQAWRRTYRYLVREAAVGDPVGRQYEWRVPVQLELSPMRAAARLLLGSHDFAAFGSSPAPGHSTVRTVDRAEVERREGLVGVEIRADAFLRGMMRNLAGALVAVGSRRVSVSELARALSSPCRRGPWLTAPAHGLHQWRVDYRQVAQG